MRHRCRRRILQSLPLWRGPAFPNCGPIAMRSIAPRLSPQPIFAGGSPTSIRSSAASANTAARNSSAQQRLSRRGFLPRPLGDNCLRSRLARRHQESHEVRFILLGRYDHCAAQDAVWAAFGLCLHPLRHHRSQGHRSAAPAGARTPTDRRGTAARHHGSRAFRHYHLRWRRPVPIQQPRVSRPVRTSTDRYRIGGDCARRLRSPRPCRR